MQYITEIILYKGQCAVIIPDEIVRIANLKAGDKVEVSLLPDESGIFVKFIRLHSRNA